MTDQTAESVEEVLREDLARGDAVIATARPVLRHLLTSDDSGLFNDQTVARVRGMVRDVAEQLLLAQAAAAEVGDGPAYVAPRLDRLEQALCEDTAFLAHLHALAVEAQFVERLQGRSAIDPVLTPLVNEMLVAKDAATAGLAMAVLAAQARFQQHCRRMELPLNELPGDLFHQVLERVREHSAEDAAAAASAEQELRDGYQEGLGRLGLIARLVIGLGHGAVQALHIDHAGVSVFASAVSLASGQERDRVILSFAERQGARLALALRAAGLEPRAAVAQLLHLHPGISLPGGFEALRADRAAALLSSSPRQTGA